MEIIRFLGADRRRSIVAWRRVAGSGAEMED